MVAGFLSALDELKLIPRIQLTATTAWNVKSQILRFPEISWIDVSKGAKQDLFDPSCHECWAGVGDTPLQLSCGDWFLNKMLANTKIISGFSKKVLINIGAESEIMSRKEDFTSIIKIFDKISTRDEESTNIIQALLGSESEKVYTASDLANISLPMILKDNRCARHYELGLIIANDTFSECDIEEIGLFIASSKGIISFIAGETRKDPSFERGVYKQLTKGLWSPIKRKAQLCIPPYNTGSLNDLVRPICECNTIISSRYHCLLIAAWAGCRVSAIARSSKVLALAKTLGIPFIPPPITHEKMRSLQEASKYVSKDILMELNEKAKLGIEFSLGNRF